jgi:5-methylcytosine-specific restriction endonuclease McrA
MGKHAHLYSSPLWARLRRAQLQAHPLCAYCLQAGQHTPATVADHKQPHRGSLALFANPANLQSLCSTCHSSTKQRAENRGGVAPGCNAQGLPLCGAHPWARKV